MLTNEHPNTQNTSNISIPNPNSKYCIFIYKSGGDIWNNKQSVWFPSAEAVEDLEVETTEGMLLQLLTSAKHQSLAPNFLLHLSFSSLSKINLNLMPCLGIKLQWGLPSTHEACNRASALRETGIYIVYLEEKQEVYYIWVNTGFCFNNRWLEILH